MDEHAQTFLRFFYACVLLAETHGGKYEDDVIKIDGKCWEGFEIVRKENLNPVVYSKDVTHKGIYRQHGEWQYLNEHVSNLILLQSRAMAETAHQWNDYREALIAKYGNK